MAAAFDESHTAPLHAAKDLTEPAVVCRATPPYQVVYANHAWEQLCGYTSSEMLGRSLRVLQGPATDHAAVERLMDSVRRHEACVIPSLINYDKMNRPFSHTVSIMPIDLPGPNGQAATGYFRATSIEVSQLQAAGRSAVASLDLSQTFGIARDAVDTTAMALISAHYGSQSAWDCAALSCGPPAMIVLTQASPPYAIMWASPHWLNVCGFTMPEIVGGTLRCIQGPATDKGAIGCLMTTVQNKQRCSIPNLVNYDKSRRPFMHTLTIFPVAGDVNTHRNTPMGMSGVAPSPADITMYRAESTNVSLSCGGVFAPYGQADEQMEAPEEEDHVWGDDFEDVLHRMNCLGSIVEQRFSSLAR